VKKLPQTQHLVSVQGILRQNSQDTPLFSQYHHKILREPTFFAPHLWPHCKGVRAVSYKLNFYYSTFFVKCQ
jgi:hypothetical protein